MRSISWRAVRAVPLATILASACGCTGLTLFSIHTRRAMHTATNIAADLFGRPPDGGLVHYNAVALRAVTAAVVLCAVGLALSTVASIFSHVLRLSRPLAAPRRAVAYFLGLACSIALAATLAADASLAAITAAAIASRLGDFVSGYGGRFTDKVVDRANAVVSRSSPLTDALGLTARTSNTTTVPGGAYIVTCPSECFNAARLPLLHSDACICGNDLHRLQRALHRSFEQAVTATIGAALLAGASTLLYGIVMAHAARAFYLRAVSHMSPLAAAKDAEKDRVPADFLNSAKVSAMRGTAPRTSSGSRRISFQEDGDVCLGQTHVVEMSRAGHSRNWSA